MKPTVLILCTGNSCRSHIAEGFLRAAAGEFVNVESAGSHPTGYVHPLAIKVMAEVGIDLSGHRSKHLKEFLGQPIRTVITVCGNLDQGCPVFPRPVAAPSLAVSGSGPGDRQRRGNSEFLPPGSRRDAPRV